MNTIQRIAKNFFALFFSGAVVQGADFLVIIYLAKVLGPGGFGMISFALILSSFFILLSTLGFPLLGTREIARTQESEKEWIGCIFLFRTCISIIAFCLLCLFPYFIHMSHDLKLLVLLYGFNLFPLALYMDWVFRGRERMEYVGYGRILGVFIYALCVFLFVSGSDRILFVPVFYAMGNLAAVMLFLYSYIRLFGNIKLSIPPVSRLKSILFQAAPIGLSTLMVHSIYYMDTVLLEFFTNNETVGYYNAGYRIVFLLIMLIGIFSHTVFPLLSKYFLQSKKHLAMLQQYNVKIMIAFGLLATTLGSVLAEPIILFLYGDAYEPAATAFKILIWSFALICINTPFAWGLLACNRQNSYLKIVTFQFLVNLGLNICLIPSYGIIGAAVSTTSAELSGIPFYISEFSKITLVNTRLFMVKACFASSITAAFLFITASFFNLIFLLTAGTGIFVAILVMTRGINLKYAMEFKEIFHDGR